MPRRKRRSKGMNMEIKMNGKDWQGYNGKCWHTHKSIGCGYFLGFLGALVYYLQTSTGFWNSILAILKAMVWPAFLVYHLLGL